MSEPEINFFDPAIQELAPASTVLGFLRTLSFSYQKLTTHTHQEEMAIGALLIAKGIQVTDREEPEGQETGNPLKTRVCYVRLTSSGSRWQSVLKEYEAKEPVKARGAVLKFVSDAFNQNRDRFDQQERRVEQESKNESEVVKALSGIELAIREITTTRGPDDGLEQPVAEADRDAEPSDVAPEKKFIHKPWPGSDSWENWGVGVDEHGVWHLFHFVRSGEATAVYRWRHHRHVRVKIAAGQMDEIARRFIELRSIPVGNDEIPQLKPTVSRLRTILRAAVKAEGHEPKGNPILSPTAERPSYLTELKFGTVE